MRRLRMEGNERLDLVHIVELSQHVEEQFRRFAAGLHGVGLLHLPSQPTYNSTTRRLTFPVGTTAIDPDGNLVYLDDALESEPIAASDVGVSPVVVWAAVEPGSVPSTDANRVEWVDVNVERSRPRKRFWKDSVSLVVAASQPPDTASGTQYFPVAKYLSWAGSPSAPATLAPWWTVNSWREELDWGANFDGLLPMLGELVVRLADNLIGADGEWVGAAGETAYPNNLNGLAERLTLLEDWQEALDAYWADGTWQNVSLTAMQPDANWEWATSVWRTGTASAALVAELTWPAWRKANVVRVRVLPSSSLNVSLSLIRYSKLTHAQTTLDTATATAGSAEQTLQVSFGSGAQDLSDEGYTYHLVVSTSGTGSVDKAVVYAVSLSSARS